MKEPGELAFDAWRAAYAKIGIPWRMLGDDERAEWAAVESAIRAAERAKVIEECAKVAEDYRLPLEGGGGPWDDGCISTRADIAAAIRALGEKKDG